MLVIAGFIAMLFSPLGNHGLEASEKPSEGAEAVTLFLCGDVMTGRGIDQVLSHPSEPIIYESYVKDARRYVQIAEEASGTIRKPVDFSYIWGDALGELERFSPDVRIVNLETAVTTSPDYWKGKGINYRMHPENVHCITAARIDCCTLANNHILDWGYSGLEETLETLEKAGMKFSGAGRTRKEAEAPAVMEVEGKGRVLVFSFGSPTSGVPYKWAAAESRPGVNLLNDFSDKEVERIRESVRKAKRPGDIVVASIHWGGNWGYTIPRSHKVFAHRLIDKAGVDVVHGHSSHHVKGIEVHGGKLILYGCGDFLNDYEGIGGRERYRGDLSLMYLPRLDPDTGTLLGLKMVPTQVRRFRVNRASKADAIWLKDTLNREGQKLHTRAKLNKDNTLTLEWD